MSERFSLSPVQPDPDAINKAVSIIESNAPRAKYLFASGNMIGAQFQTRTVFDALLELDRMGCTRDYRVANMARNMGDEPFIKEIFDIDLTEADRFQKSEKVLELIRLGVVLGFDSPPPRPTSGFLGRFSPNRLGTFLSPMEITARTHEAEAAARRFEELHKKHTEEIAARTIAQARQQAPNTSSTIETPETQVTIEPQAPKLTKWEPESREGKSKKWLAAQDIAAKEWESAVREKDLNLTDRKGPATNARYDAAMSIVRQQILGPKTLSNVEVLAMIEFLIPRIWTQPTIPGRWFKDQLEGGQGTPLDLDGVKPAMKLTLLPEHLRKAQGSFNADEISKYNKFFRTLMRATHTDTKIQCPDRNIQYDDAIEIISRTVTISNQTIRPLITPNSTS